MWECANDYIRLLSVSWDDQRPAPYEEFQLYFGVALQEAILRRLCVDMLHMDSEWAHFGLESKWVWELASWWAFPQRHLLFFPMMKVRWYILIPFHYSLCFLFNDASKTPC